MKLEEAWCEALQPTKASCLACGDRWSVVGVRSEAVISYFKGVPRKMFDRETYRKVPCAFLVAGEKSPSTGLNVGSDAERAAVLPLLQENEAESAREVTARFGSRSGKGRKPKVPGVVRLAEDLVSSRWWK